MEYLYGIFIWNIYMNIYGISMEYQWNINGISMNILMEYLYGISMEYVWNIHDDIYGISMT